MREVSLDSPSFQVRAQRFSTVEDRDTQSLTFSDKMDLEAILRAEYTAWVEDPWTEEDEAILAQHRSFLGCTWGTIAQSLQRRSADVVNHARLMQDGTLTRMQKAWLRKMWEVHQQYVLPL